MFQTLWPLGPHYTTTLHPHSAEDKELTDQKWVLIFSQQKYFLILITFQSFLKKSYPNLDDNKKVIRDIKNSWMMFISMQKSIDFLNIMKIRNCLHVNMSIVKGVTCQPFIYLNFFKTAFWLQAFGNKILWN